MTHKTMAQRFGAAVRNRRISAEMSQETLAERADLHPTYISMVERGVRNPSLEVAERLAVALDVDLATLIQEANRQRK